MESFTRVFFSDLLALRGIAALWEDPDTLSLILALSDMNKHVCNDVYQAEKG